MAPNGDGEGDSDGWGRWGVLYQWAMELLRVDAAGPEAAGLCWKRGLEAHFGQVTVSVDDSFHSGVIEQYQLGEALLFDIHSGHHRILRAPATDEISQFVSVMVQVTGRSLLEHAGHSVELGPGSATVIDTAAASAMSLVGRYRQILLLVPRRLLAAQPHLSAGCHMHDGDAVDKLLIGQLCSLPTVAAELAHAQQQAVLCSALALLRASSGFRDTDGHRGLYRRILWATQFIDAHLGDEELTPQCVAAAQCVSRRHLDEVLSQQGVTIAGLIWQRRLMHASEALLGEGRDKTVLEIAVAHGFRSASHFSRAFRQRFGMTPSEWRGCDGGGVLAADALKKR